ncbi:MAG: alpha/beta fold hydrolase [Flavobacteriaceae bacterium]|jgi:pimeloyl-ACP methyl ester carboxylesterase|nr:alpha/beta fold hydrolase [Flavobacteriaceae bacterium]
MQILHSKIYEKHKNGTPLLVMHGFLGMLDNWGSFGKEAGEYFPVHLLDLRNHGKSFHSDSMTHKDLADDILNYMNFYNLLKINILGHSLGGKAAMQFAVTFPEKVEKLIVVDISPKAYPSHHQEILKALESVDFDKVNSRQEVEEILAKYIPEKSVIQFLAKNLYWTEQKKLAWRFNLKTLSEHYNDFVSNAVKFGVFSGETLFISGENSDYILPQDGFLIKQQFPNSKIVKIKNAGHWVHADNPKDFTETVKTFLKPD